MKETKNEWNTCDIEAGSKSDGKLKIVHYSQPKYIGKCRCLLYIKNNPIFVIGPNCYSKKQLHQTSVQYL